MTALSVEIASYKVYVIFNSHCYKFRLSAGSYVILHRTVLMFCSAFSGDSRIVILDEATSHLGARLDDRIDRAFRTRFEDSTVLMITHNMEKTLNCDKILVLDGGQLKEFDTPERLLASKTSLFYMMARDSGLID